jgi:hypothetical protein
VAVDVHQVLAVLREREPIFHGPAWPTTRPELDQLVADEFWEVGASGAVYDRELVLQSVAARSVDPMDETWIASDFACRQLDTRTYALTYSLRQGERLSRRLTIWRRTADDWQVVCHHGTLVGR